MLLDKRDILREVERELPLHFKSFAMKIAYSDMIMESERADCLFERETYERDRKMMEAIYNYIIGEKYGEMVHDSTEHNHKFYTTEYERRIYLPTITAERLRQLLYSEQILIKTKGLFDVYDMEVPYVRLP